MDYNVVKECHAKFVRTAHDPVCGMARSYFVAYWKPTWVGTGYKIDILGTGKHYMEHVEGPNGVVWTSSIFHKTDPTVKEVVAAFEHARVVVSEYATFTWITRSVEEVTLFEK